MTARFERWRSLLATHQAFAQLLVIFFVFRLLAAFFLQPGGFLTAATPDQFFYYHFAGINTAGLSPFVDYWTEFPPIFPWIVVLATRLSILIPAWSNGIFWFNGILRWLILVFEAATLALIYATVSNLDSRERALNAAQAFAVLFVPLWVFLGWFDSVVLFFLMLALYGLTQRHPIMTGLGIGLGFGAKLFPLAVLPAAVRVFSRRKLVILIGTILLSLVLVFGPLMLISPEQTLAFFTTLQGRSSWETVWALLDGYQGWGIVSSLAVRNDPASAGQLVPGTSESHLPWLLITGIFGIVGLIAWTRPIDWQNPRRSVAFSALTFGMMLLYAKGYSPQWALYLTALSLVVLRGWRGIMYAILLDVLTALEWPVAFIMFDSAPSFLAAIIIIRTALTIVLCIEFAIAAFSGARWTQPARKWLPRAAGVSFALALLIGLFPASATYRQLRYEVEPTNILLNSWVNDLDSEQLVLSTQPIVVQRLSALVPDQVTLRQMPNGLGNAWVEPDVWLDEVTEAESYDYIWLIDERSQMEYWDISDDLMRAVSDRACWVAIGWYDTTRAMAFAGELPPIAMEVDINFEDRVRVTGYGANQALLPYYGMQCVALGLEIADPTDPTLELEVNLTSSTVGRVETKRLDLAEHLENIGFGGASGTITLGLAYLGDQAPGTYGIEVGIYDDQSLQWLDTDSQGDEGRVQLGVFELE